MRNISERLVSLVGMSGKKPYLLLDAYPFRSGEKAILILERKGHDTSNIAERWSRAWDTMEYLHDYSLASKPPRRREVTLHTMD